MRLKPSITLFALLVAAPLMAQSAQPAAQAPVPARPEFDVASVKQSPPGPRTFPTSNVPLTPGSTAQPNGSLLQAKGWPLVAYIMFAYDIQPDQLKALTTSLPPWALSDTFDIDARAEGSPTRDQMRAMMKSLLEDRFTLKLHTDTADRPIFALVLAKPGKTGPQLQAHTDTPPCPAGAASASALPIATSTVTGGFPTQCGSIMVLPSQERGRLGIGGRNVSIDTIASTISAAGGFIGDLTKPVQNQTGLTGNWDFVIQFAPQMPAGMPSPMAEPNNDAPTFLEALTDQLGLKLTNATGPVQQIVIDHIDHPTEN